VTSPMERPSSHARWGGAGSAALSRVLPCAIVLSALMLCACSCSRGTEKPGGGGSGADDVAVVRKAQNGPVAVTLTASPGELDIARHVVVRMEVVAERGVTVHADRYERTLAEDEGRFEYRVVRSRSEESEPTADGKLRWMYECELEFFLAGEYELPAAEVSFVDTRALADEGEGQEGDDDASSLQTLATEAVPVLVHQTAGNELSQEELATIKTLPPVELPWEWRHWWWVGAIGIVAAFAVALLLIRRRRRKAETVEHIPADIWARRELAALVAENLIAKRMIQLFYYRISGVVRGYVERRFGVSAPEMTTEEFLSAAAADRRFGEHNTTELVRFLDACDRVKYARHEPLPDEADRLVQAAGAFVERTRERIAPRGVSGAENDAAREQAA